MNNTQNVQNGNGQPFVPNVDVGHGNDGGFDAIFNALMVAVTGQGGNTAPLRMPNVPQQMTRNRPLTERQVVFMQPAEHIPAPHPDVRIPQNNQNRLINAQQQIQAHHGLLVPPSPPAAQKTIDISLQSFFRFFTRNKTARPRDITYTFGQNFFFMPQPKIGWNDNNIQIPSNTEEIVSLISDDLAYAFGNDRARLIRMYMFERYGRDNTQKIMQIPRDVVITFYKVLQVMKRMQNEITKLERQEARTPDEDQQLVKGKNLLSELQILFSDLGTNCPMHLQEAIQQAELSIYASNIRYATGWDTLSETFIKQIRCNIMERCVEKLTRLVAIDHSIYGVEVVSFLRFLVFTTCSIKLPNPNISPETREMILKYVSNKEIYENLTHVIYEYLSNIMNVIENMASLVSQTEKDALYESGKKAQITCLEWCSISGQNPENIAKIIQERINAATDEGTRQKLMLLLDWTIKPYSLVTFGTFCETLSDADLLGEFPFIGEANQNKLFAIMIITVFFNNNIMHVPNDADLRPEIK